MWRILSNGAMIFAGIVSVPAIIATIDAPSPIQPAFPHAENKVDPRLQLLEKFFESNDSPARPFSHFFLSEADRFHLDWRLLPSISYVETAAGKSGRNNNWFGWECGQARFPSIRAGIHTVADRLANSKAYKDKALDDLLWTYNPNPDYSRIVRSVMVRIAPDELLAE
jgi:hypothetical protein